MRSAVAHQMDLEEAAMTPDFDRVCSVVHADMQALIQVRSVDWSTD